MPYGSYSLSALANLFRKPVTTAFPAQAYRPLPGTRGRIQVNLEACNYCSLCALRCPSAAITVDRQAKVFALDEFKCVVCSACVDACVKKALTCESQYSDSALSRDAA